MNPGPYVLACLYRAGYDEIQPLSNVCAQNIHRVLRLRATRVNLIPEVEENCREALSEYCSENVQPTEVYFFNKFLIKKLGNELFTKTL